MLKWPYLRAQLGRRLVGPKPPRIRNRLDAHDPSRNSPILWSSWTPPSTLSPQLISRPSMDVRTRTHRHPHTSRPQPRRGPLPRTSSLRPSSANTPNLWATTAAVLESSSTLLLSLSIALNSSSIPSLCLAIALECSAIASPSCLLEPCRPFLVTSPNIFPQAWRFRPKPLSQQTRQRVPKLSLSTALTPSPGG